MIQHDTWILVFLGITLLLALISGLLCLRFSSLQQHYRHLHQRLQEQETTGAQHQSMLSHLPVFLILHTRTEICYCNPAALLALGQMDASQVIGKPLASFVMPSEMASVTAFIESAFQQTAEMPALKKAVRFSTWPDRSCLLTLMAQPFVYNHQPAVMITSTTAVPAADNRASQEQLYELWHHHHRVEAAYALISGIAHEFHSIFREVSTLFHRLKTTCSDALYQDTLVAETKVQYGLQTAQSILDFAKFSIASFSTISLWRAVEVAQSVLEPALSSYLSFQLVRETSLDHIHGSESLFHQLILNLVTTVKGIVPTCNQVTIAVCSPLFVSMPSFFGSPDPKQYVALKIGDNSNHSDLLITALDPTMFAKECGPSFGLSLLIARNIVKLHNGMLGVQYEPQHRLNFTLLFPLVSAACLPSSTIAHRAPATSAVKIKSNKLVHGRTILVVDDEQYLCDIISRVLHSAGYTPLTATSSHDALRLLAEKDYAVDLCIFDLTMPDMNGEALFRHVRQQAPQMPVIITSGSMEPAYQHRLQMSGVTSFIIKPFKLKALLDTVESILQDQSKAEL